MEVAFDDGSQILDKRFDLALCQSQLIQIYQPWNLALGLRAAGWKYLLEFIEFLKNYGSFKWQGNLFLREKWFYNVLWVLQLQFYNYNATPNSIPPRSRGISQTDDERTAREVRMSASIGKSLVYFKIFLKMRKLRTQGPSVHIQTKKLKNKQKL